MADAFPIDVAQLVALFLESIFYGIYLVSFGMCMYLMLMKGQSRRQGKHSIFLVIALLFFIFATLDVVILLHHVLDAFIWYHGPGGAIAELSDISYWLNAMKIVSYVAQTSIADGILIYRCYIVYSSSWVVAAPLCVLWIAGAVVEGFTCYIEFTLHESTLINTARIVPFITSLMSITLVLNTIATSLIVYKVWSIERRFRVASASASLGGSHTTPLRRAMHIIIESGLMYTVSVVVLFILYLASNNAQYAVSDYIVQIIGIAFNLIIIRIDQGKAVEKTMVSERREFRVHRRTLHFHLAARHTTTSSSAIEVRESDDLERNHSVAVTPAKPTAKLSLPNPEEGAFQVDATLV